MAANLHTNQMLNWFRQDESRAFCKLVKTVWSLNKCYV